MENLKSPEKYSDNPVRFKSRMDHLISLGFQTLDGGEFFLERVWSGLYWEKINDYSDSDWAEYMNAIYEAIAEHRDESGRKI